MGIASRLGPWLLGTVKSSTGTTAGTVRNMGATVVAQTTSIPYTTINASLTGTVCALPAGALVTSVQFVTTTVFSSAVTLQVTINGTAWKATADTVTAVGFIPVAPQATASAVVGTTDSLVTYTATGSGLTTGNVVVVVNYVVRNPDGTYYPTSSTGP